MSDLHDSLGNLYSDPNGSAYQKTETRQGPPLDYVAEKLRACLEGAHTTITRLRAYPADLPHPAGVSAPPGETARDAYLIGPLWYGFYAGVVSYLALHNMLALANDHGLTERLADMTHAEFSAWLDGIDHEGSVTG